MKKHCELCGKEFEAKRATARFDSAACKLKFNRQENKIDESNDQPVKETKPKQDWYDAFTPSKPVADKFQPENGDVMCEQWGLLKGTMPKGTGTELSARYFLWHDRYHQKNCFPTTPHGEAINK